MSSTASHQPNSSGVAQAVEENGGPAPYVAALRAVADRLEELGWWLAEPLEAAACEVSIAQKEPL